LEEAKPYADIPGPSKLQLIRAFLPGGKWRKSFPVFSLNKLDGQ